MRHVEGEVALLRAMTHDYRMVYSKEGVAVPSTTDQFELVNVVLPQVERFERDQVKPFLEKCQSRIQQPIRQYLQELNETKVGHLAKNRQKRLLDFEMTRDKYNNAIAASSSTSAVNAHAQEEAARLAFENARAAFDDADRQAKQFLRQVVMKRYTLFHPLVSELYGEILSEYYDTLASFGQMLRKVKSIPEPQVVMPEPYSWGTDVEEEEEEYSSYSTPTPSYGAPQASRPPMGGVRMTPALPNLPPNPKANIPPLPNRAAIPERLNKDWYYLDANSDQKGPVKPTELKLKLKLGHVNTETYVVTEGMANWETLGNHELYKYIQ